MVLSIKEIVYLVEHDFRSYGFGGHNGPSLKPVSEKYQQQFNKVAPSKSSCSEIS